jgi:UPF0755 protein
MVQQNNLSSINSKQDTQCSLQDKKRKNNKCSCCQKCVVIFFIMFVVIVMGLGFCFGWFYYAMRIDLVQKDTEFFVEPGSSITKVATMLENNGIIKNKYHFIFESYISHKNNNTLKAGTYQLYVGNSIDKIFELMFTGDVVQRKIMIPEGYTVYQIVDILKHEEKIDNNIQQDKLEIMQLFPEGSLMPDTYHYITGAKLIDVLYGMQKKMQDFLQAEWEQRDKLIDELINSVEEAVILASIVEKEAFWNEETPKIAGVYFNRLRIGMPLQADPTVIYGMTKGETVWQRKLLFKDLKHDSVYNTYIHKGLPPTPICNPGRDAILAVLHPEPSKYLYFVVDKTSDKRHIFSTSYAEHRRNVKIQRFVGE